MPTRHPTGSTQGRSRRPPDLTTSRPRSPPVPHRVPFCVLRKKLWAGGTTRSQEQAHFSTTRRTGPTGETLLTWHPTGSTQDRSGWPPDIIASRLRPPPVPLWAPLCVLRKCCRAVGTTVSCTGAELGENSLQAQLIALVSQGKEYQLGIS